MTGIDPLQVTNLVGGTLKGFAPRPKTIADTGLSEIFLGDLICKHLRVAGILDIEALSSRLALPGAVVEKVLNFLRGEGQVEVHGAAMTGGGLRFALTDRGRATAAEARERLRATTRLQRDEVGRHVTIDLGRAGR